MPTIAPVQVPPKIMIISTIIIFIIISISCHSLPLFASRLAAITDSDVESSGKEGPRMPTIAPVQVPPKSPRFLFPTSGSFSSPRSAHMDASIPGSPSSAQQRMQAPQVGMELCNQYSMTYTL